MSENICPNCNREILENFQSHVLFCVRHMILCNKCLDLVRKAEYEKHLEEIHPQYKCLKCEMIIDVENKEKHEKEECKFRVIGKCKFCNMDLFLTTPVDHEEICGNRTLPCKNCKNLVVVKSWAEHEKKCEALPKIKPLDRPKKFNPNFSEPLLKPVFVPCVVSPENIPTPPVITSPSQLPPILYLCPLCNEESSRNPATCIVHMKVRCSMKKLYTPTAEPQPYIMEGETKKLLTPKDIQNRRKLEKELESREYKYFRHANPLKDKVVTRYEGYGYGRGMEGMGMGHTLNDNVVDDENDTNNNNINNNNNNLNIPNNIIPPNLYNNLPLQPNNNLPLQPNNLPLQPNNLPLQPNNLPLQPNNLPLQPNNLPLQPGGVGGFANMRNPFTRRGGYLVIDHNNNNNNNNNNDNNDFDFGTGGHKLNE